MTDAHDIRADAGTITIAGSVLDQVVQRAAERDGVRVRRPKRALDVSVEEGSATVRLELAVRYGEVLPELAQGVQERVAAALQRTCGLDVAAVDVSVEELER